MPIKFSGYMKAILVSVFVVAGWATAGGQALAEPAPGAVKVTTDNFIRAESDVYFSRIVKDNGFGRFNPTRNLPDIHRQLIIRLNRDTLYSAAVVDLDAGPVTLSVPDAGQRFLSVQIINEDHFTTRLIHEPGEYVLTRAEVGTRYAMLGVRILVNPDEPRDLDAVHDLQDRLRLTQADKGRFEIPNWDMESLKTVRRHLVALSALLPDARSMFGSKDEVEPVRHLLGTAFGWGGNPEKEATYLNVNPARADGKTVYRLTVGEVPVDGFWSISVYNAEGFFQENPLGRYAINNITAKKDASGNITVQFGGCKRQTDNCIPTMPGWNYMVRLYRPHQAILDGSWKFPEAQIVK